MTDQTLQIVTVESYISLGPMAAKDDLRNRLDALHIPSLSLFYYLDNVLQATIRPERRRERNM